MRALFLNRMNGAVRFACRCYYLRLCGWCLKRDFGCGLLRDGVGACCCAFGLCSLLFCVFVCAFVTYRVELHDF